MVSQDHRTRKRGPEVYTIEDSDEEDLFLPSTGSQNGRNLNTTRNSTLKSLGDRSFASTSSFSTSFYGKNTEDSGDLFCDRFAPTKVTDLAVHSAKVNELKGWLLEQKKEASCLLLTGPAGSGKSTALRVLSAHLNIDLEEWEYEKTERAIPDRGYDSDDEGNWKRIDREMDHFLSFVRGIAGGTGGSSVVKVVDTLPVMCFSEPHRFRKILLPALSSSRQSVVFCLSDVDSCYDVSPRRIFNQQLINDGGITTLSFNPIAPTFMKKAIGRMAKLMLTDRKMTQNLQDKIVANSNGDLRWAINAMHFSMDDKGRLADLDSGLHSTLNDEIFHMVARILHAKRAETTGRALSRGERTPPAYDINDTLKMSNIVSSNLMMYLHEHEPSFSPSIANTARCLDAISFADAITQRWDVRRQGEEYQTQISTRAVYFYNDGRAPKAVFHAISKPKWKSLEREVEGNLKELREIVGFSRIGATTGALQLAALSKLRVPVYREQLDIVSYVARRMDFPWSLGRQQWRNQMQRKTQARTGPSVYESDFSAFPDPSIEEEQEEKEFEIEEELSDDSFDDDLELVPY